jgi:hypothetical protein
MNERQQRGYLKRNGWEYDNFHGWMVDNRVPNRKRSRTEAVECQQCYEFNDAAWDKALDSNGDR